MGVVIISVSVKLSLQYTTCSRLDQVLGTSPVVRKKQRVEFRARLDCNCVLVAKGYRDSARSSSHRESIVLKVFQWSYFGEFPECDRYRARFFTAQFVNGGRSFNGNAVSDRKQLERNHG